MKRRVTPRKERADAVRVRGVLERLEDRAMLSAHGLTDFGHGGQDFRPRMEAGPRFSDSPAVASQQQRSMSYETQTFSGGREFGGPHGELQYPPPMQMAFQPSARTRPFEQHPFQNPSWNQPFADQPPTFIFFEEAPHFEPPIAESHGALPRVISKPPSSVVPPGDILGSLNASNRPLAIDHFQALPVPLEQVRSTITSGAGVLAIGWTLPDVPTGLQIYSREIMTAGALSTVAREVAFQEFSSSLFRSNATSSYDRANLSAMGIESTQPESFDGFIRPTDESILDPTVNSSDAVVREREAIDAVLDDLQDLDSVPPATESVDASLQVDLQADAALDELPAGEVDKGMVLLQSIGDANGSSFDLTPVYALHADQNDRPAKIETSVGMFQAIDVQTDDAPIGDAAPQMESTSELTPEIKFNENIPSKSQPRSSNKAAALAGATTLTGALLWLGGSGRRHCTPESTAQKRRPSRR